MANEQSNYPLFIGPNGEIVLTPLYMEDSTVQAVVDADIIVNGDAQVVTLVGGVLQATYIPAPFGVVTAGDANVTTLRNYDTEFNGVIVSGEADATVASASPGEADATFTGAEGERGGKGTPKPRRRYKVTPQRTVHYYHAEAYFEHTKQLGGEAITSFVPARYSFIKSLPPLPARPETPLYDIAALNKVSDSEFLKVYNDLYGRSITPSVFAYKSNGEMSVGGSAKNTHIDFTKIILDQDEDLLMTDMLSSTSELMPTRRSMNKKLLRMMLEDEELLDLELL